MGDCKCRFVLLLGAASEEVRGYVCHLVPPLPWRVAQRLNALPSMFAQAGGNGKTGIRVIDCWRLPIAHIDSRI
jgi:hypothetical protein